jgi:ElaB/YqjD/DUF883 family membrane-anchored ribosome-binding protein
LALDDREIAMTSLKSLREELDELRADILSKRAKSGESVVPGPIASDSGEKRESVMEHQLAELNRMVKAMLDDAETTVATHPAATVAGALALGIVIGRLTAR